MMAFGQDIPEIVPWLDRRVPYFVDPTDASRLCGSLEAAGFEVCLLDGKDLADEHGLLAAIKPVLGFPDYFGINWDAFVDCMGDLAEAAANPIALVWTSADALASRDLHAFVRSIHLILSTAGGLAAETSPFRLELFLVGKMKRP